jgi:ribosomal-protein-alanine N-acetyltransferase
MTTTMQTVIGRGLSDGPGLFVSTGVSTAKADSGAASSWRQMLPVLAGKSVILRELRESDAPSLLMMLATDEVAQFISPPPTSLAEFQQFIAWTHRERSEGRYACFAVVPEGLDAAIGIFQVKALDPDWGTTEWGFAIGSPFWGRGVFEQGAALTVAFAFEHLRAFRLEARATVDNGRGNGALRKMGARANGVLRESFRKDGRLHDQVLWSLLESDWRRGSNGLWQPSEIQSHDADRTDAGSLISLPTLTH